MIEFKKRRNGMADWFNTEDRKKYFELIKKSKEKMTEKEKEFFRQMYLAEEFAAYGEV
jgi:hypothetical protein